MILPLSKQLRPVKIAIRFLTISQWSDSSKAGVCLYLGRFSIFALFLHTAQHYFVSIVLWTVFHLRGFVVFSLSCRLSRSPPLTSWVLFFLPPSVLQFHLVLYSESSTGLEAHKWRTHSPLTAPHTSNHLPHQTTPALKIHRDLLLLLPISPAILSPPALHLATPTPTPHRPGDRFFVPDICFVGWLIEMSMWGEGL